MLQSCLISSVTDVLGEGGKRALVYYIPIENITNEPRAFHEKLTSILKAGAPTLEYIVAKELYRRMGFPFNEQEQFDFVKCVEEVKKMAAKSPLPAEAR